MTPPTTMTAAPARAAAVPQRTRDSDAPLPPHLPQKQILNPHMGGTPIIIMLHPLKDEQ